MKNLPEAWEQAAVQLLMTHNLRSQGLHDLYRKMVQHEEIVTKRVKKTEAVALFSKKGETSSSSKGKQPRKDTNFGDEAAFGGNSSESDE